MAVHHLPIYANNPWRAKFLPSMTVGFHAKYTYQMKLTLKIGTNGNLLSFFAHRTLDRIFFCVFISWIEISLDERCTHTIFGIIYPYIRNWILNGWKWKSRHSPFIAYVCSLCRTIWVYILYDTADTDGEHYRASRIRNRLTELMEYCSNLFWRWSVVFFCFVHLLERNFVLKNVWVILQHLAEMQEDECFV